MEDCVSAGGKNWRDADRQAESARNASEMPASKGVVLRTPDGQCRSSWAFLYETLAEVTVFPTMETCLAAEKKRGGKKEAVAGQGSERNVLGTDGVIAP